MPSSIPRDVQEFLDGYPDNTDDQSLNGNLEFYLNKRRCRPDNLLIDEIHERWRGDYSKLEYRHGFIQWLFPIHEHGMNYESQALQPHELVAMKVDGGVVARVRRSYRMMLDFYGMDLSDVETGLLERAEPDTKNAERYRNLARSAHNYLRISRILKHLSEMGLEHLNAGFLLHVLNEQSEHEQLNAPDLRSSMDRWWANCIRNEEEREWIGKLIQRVRKDDNFTFTRRMYEEALARRAETGSLTMRD